MRIHTNRLSAHEISAALASAKRNGKITSDVSFPVFSHTGSRTHHHAYEIQLGTADKRSGGRTNRRLRNSGTRGALNAWAETLRYAATRDEWGWFLAAIYAADPTVKAGPYRDAGDFHAKTRHAYEDKGMATQ